jgi:hypothetical protein
MLIPTIMKNTQNTSKIMFLMLIVLPFSSLSVNFWKKLAGVLSGEVVLLLRARVLCAGFKIAGAHSAFCEGV